MATNDKVKVILSMMGKDEKSVSMGPGLTIYEFQDILSKDKDQSIAVRRFAILMGISYGKAVQILHDAIQKIEYLESTNKPNDDGVIVIEQPQIYRAEQLCADSAEWEHTSTFGLGPATITVVLKIDLSTLTGSVTASIGLFGYNINIGTAKISPSEPVDLKFSVGVGSFELKISIRKDGSNIFLDFMLQGRILFRTYGPYKTSIKVWPL